MKSEYVMAIETRLKWLRFANGVEGGFDPKAFRSFHDPSIAASTRAQYQYVLEHGDTYYMDRHFCDMVDHARLEVPGNLEFDDHWMLSPQGWMYIAQPFAVPRLSLLTDAVRAKFPDRDPKELEEDMHRKFDPHMQAIAWLPLTFRGAFEGPVRVDQPTTPDGYWFALFMSFPDGSFNPWSYFVLRPGDRLDDRIESYEESAAKMSGIAGEAYVQDETIDYNRLHEIRWTYAAMNLMAQRLATRVREHPDRATRRRAERTQQTVPPFIEVVTLRRLQLDREREGAGKDVDWQWQWAVQGHWRNQWFPSKLKHQPVFIESYIKGPPDKPVKPPTSKLFTAVR